MESNRPDNDDELARYLDALNRADCYRVVQSLTSKSAQSDNSGTVTELVEFTGANGSELGPFVRKRIDRELGVGSVYEELFAAQRAGMRFVHLPRIVECYKTAAELVVVSEYVAGETLEALCARCGASETFAVRVFPAICDAVAELHERFDPPIVHRDIKPANIIVAQAGSDPIATLIDFGIARRYRSEAAADTTHFGTRSYAPPEQYGFGQTSVRSDVYALGMILLFCLTGAADAQPTPDLLDAAGICEPLARVVLHATAFDPAERFGNARELQDAFARAMEAGALEAEKFEESASTADASTAETSVVGAPVQAATEAAASTAEASQTAASDAEASEAPDAVAISSPTEERRAAQPAGSARPRTHFEPEQPPDSFSYKPAKKPRKLSPTIGIVWDVLLCIIAASFLYMAVTTTLEPTGDLVGQPLWYVVAINWFITLPCIWGCLFLMLDRRPLVRLIPSVGTRSRLKDFIALCAYLVCAMLIVCVAMVVTDVG